MGFSNKFIDDPGCETYVQGHRCLHGRFGEKKSEVSFRRTLALCSKYILFNVSYLAPQVVYQPPTLFFLKNVLYYFDLFYNKIYRQIVTRDAVL